MKPFSFMLIAGEASGDLLAAELVGTLRKKVLEIETTQTDDVQPLRTELAPEFFGAGGPRMKAAGVQLVFDLTQFSVIGISDVFKKYFEFRRMFRQLFKLAIERQPDVIIGVDYGGFNLRFGKAIKNYIRKHLSQFKPWNPKIIQYVSPQVWASRPNRAWTLAENYDLLLSIFPFEKEWYAKRVPKLRVEFVGHPLTDRLMNYGVRTSKERAQDASIANRKSQIVLLPGSRADEVRRHWPVVLGTFELLRRELPSLHGRVVLPNESLARVAKSFSAPPGLEIRVGDLPAALADADLAISKSGTITMECAAFGVPAVVLYKTSWPTYWIGRQIVGVKFLAMPNLLAGEEIFPEFIQSAATPENISRAALELLRDATRRELVKSKLAKVIASLGAPRANIRAAEAIVGLLP